MRSNLVEAIVARALGPERLGNFRFRRNPWFGRAWGAGPFNGQKWRCLLVAELVAKSNPAAIVETGTYLGTSTEWLASFQVPVYSCEASPDNYWFARARFKATPNVTLALCDSRAALRSFLAGPLRDQTSRPILFYLDAHWNSDLPLADEIEIIFGICESAIVLVDDFQVPDDAGYGYDDYGLEKALIPDYVAKSMKKHDLKALYPTCSADEETGAKRGCVVLAKRSTLGSILDSISLLRPSRVIFANEAV